MFQFQQHSTIHINFLHPNLTQTKLLQKELYPKLTHLPSFCELVDVSLTWATYGFLGLVADEGTDPQSSKARLHFFLSNKVGIESLHSWARWDRLTTVSWARTTNTTPTAPSLEQRFHRPCIRAASPSKVELVGFLTKEVRTLVLRCTLLTNIASTVSSC